MTQKNPREVNEDPGWRELRLMNKLCLQDHIALYKSERRKSVFVATTGVQEIIPLVHGADSI